MNKAALMASLTAEEGFRSLVYDDATGKDLKPGMLVQGNPTVAVGWNVSGRPCTYELGQIILGYHADQTWADVKKVLPWVESQPDPVQRALCDMAFNMRGAAQLRTFGTFLALIQSGKYEEAAKDLETTLWWKQVGTRGPRVQALIRQAIASV
jgi:GH24 family phage-related lysozyme (muramidase)